MSNNLPPYLRDQALDPKWSESTKVHDWRNYINDHVRTIWDTFTEEQKFALVEQADAQAGAEEWE